MLLITDNPDVCYFVNYYLWFYIYFSDTEASQACFSPHDDDTDDDDDDICLP